MAAPPSPEAPATGFPFVGVVALLAAATVVAMWALFTAGYGGYAPYAPAAALVAGLLYLFLVARPAALEEEPPVPAPGAPPEPFDDPVIEADRVASGELPPTPPEPVPAAGSEVSRE